MVGTVWGITIMMIRGEGVSVASSMLSIMAMSIFLLGLIAEQLSSLRKQNILVNINNND